ncbi:tuberin, partial [Dactylonectria macrodidyma]
AGTELPEPSPSIASPSSSSDKPASQFSDTNLPYGFLADDMRSFELLRTGTLEDRASAADSLRSSIPVSSDHSFLIDIWNAAKDLVDPGQPARARIAAWNLLTQIILVSHPGPGRLAFLTTFHSPTHPDDFQLQISAVACLTHGGRRLTEVEYISLLPILVEWMQHAYAPVPPTPRRPGSPERSQHLTARRGTARRKGNLAQIFDILLDAISPAFVNSNLAAGLSLADALLKICRTTTSEDNLKQSLRLIDILLTSQIILKFVFENCVVVIYDLYCKSGKHRPVYNRLWRTLSILLKSDHGPQIVNTLVDFLKQAPIESTNVRYINRGLRSILSVLQRLVSSDIDKGYPSVQYALLVDGLSTVATTRSYLPNLAAVLELINALFDDGQHNLHPLLLDEDWALILDVAWKCGGGTSEDPDPESPGSLCSNLVTLIKRLDFLVSQDGDFKQRETAVEFLTKVN